MLPVTVVPHTNPHHIGAKTGHRDYELASELNQMVWVKNTDIGRHLLVSTVLVWHVRTCKNSNVTILVSVLMDSG